MAIEKATGITVRLSDYSDTSQIAAFVTDSAGLVRAIARGSKRQSSSTGGPLDLLTVNEIVFSTSRPGALATLREAKTVEKFPRLRELPLFYAGLYFGELAGLFGEGSEGSREVFDLLLSALRALQEADEAEVPCIVLFFESHVLAAAGVAPNITGCARCGAAIPAKASSARVSLEDGGTLCPNCPGGSPLRPGSLAALRHIFESNLPAVRRLRLQPRLLREVSGLLSAAVIHSGERKPRLLRYVKPGPEGAWRRWLRTGGEANRLDNEAGQIYNGKVRKDGG